MNRERVSNALTGIDDELIAASLSFRAAGRSRAPERKTKVKKQNTGNGRAASKRLIALALAACLLLALTATAYALNLFGIRELYANSNRGELPEAAQELIETQQASVRGEGWSACVTESYCDANAVLLTLRIDADDGYVLVDGSEDPYSPLWAIGQSGEGTLADYAFGQGKKLLFVGADLPLEELGINSLSQRAEYLSDREMVLYVEASKTVTAPVIETVCKLSAQVVGPEDLDRAFEPAQVQRLEIPITMTEGEGVILGTYLPEDPDAIPGLHLEKLSLTRTPLGISLCLTGTPGDGYDEADLMTLRVEGLEFFGAGSLGLREDGSFFAEFEQGQGDAGDSLTLMFLDWEKAQVGTVTFVKR